jgi:hypothetical protein
MREEVCAVVGGEGFLTFATDYSIIENDRGANEKEVLDQVVCGDPR